jgi:hypothetical protein
VVVVCVVGICRTSVGGGKAWWLGGVMIGVGSRKVW